MAPLPTTDNTPATIDKNLIDGLLKVLTGQDTGPVYWDLTRIPIDTTPNYQWDPNSAAAAYQDYTDYQILYCVDATDTKGDPFSGSQPLGTQTCQNEKPTSRLLSNSTIRVAATTTEVKQVRYEILRAFGCLGDFVDKSNPDTCNTDKIFNGNADNKVAPTAGTCPYDNSKFPWGYPAVTFNGQSTSSSTWSTSSPGTASTSAKPGTSTKGTGAIGPVVSVVSGLLMVSLAHLFKA
ncbi:hypothetical protein M3Y99_00840500 [Aphelenchoides fujianensis]|nr:hypothetical protein M3Y99_00840500 [Aphelenchoides fujianensis]